MILQISQTTNAKVVQLNLELKRNNYHITKPRTAVFECLQNSASLLSINELIEKVSGVIDRSSVYRTIELFEELGIIKRIHIGWKHKLELSDKYSYHHHHITCTNCRQVIAIKSDAKIERLIHLIALTNNVKPQTHQLEIEGLCQDCC